MLARSLRPAVAASFLAILAACAEQPTPTEGDSDSTRTYELRPRAAYVNTTPASLWHPWVGRVIRIESVHSRYYTPQPECLEVAGLPVTNQDIDHLPCDYGANQRFIVTAASDYPGRNPAGLVHLRSIQNPSMCVDVRAGTANGGERLQLFPCHWGPNQTFRLPTPTAGWVTMGYIRTENSGFGMVFDVPLPFVSGQYTQQYQFNGGTNQRWFFFDPYANRYM